MTKYYCKCGKEIKRLVVYWQSSVNGYSSVAAYLYCECCANRHIQTEPLEGSHTNIPVVITVPTKEKAVNQIIAQYLKNNCDHVFLSKLTIRQALKDINKKNEK